MMATPDSFLLLKPKTQEFLFNLTAVPFKQVPASLTPYLLPSHQQILQKSSINKYYNKAVSPRVPDNVILIGTAFGITNEILTEANLLWHMTKARRLVVSFSQESIIYISIVIYLQSAGCSNKGSLQSPLTF